VWIVHITKNKWRVKMSDLIKIDTDTLEERLNCMDAEKDALEDRVKELEAVVETLQNEVEIQREEAQLPTEASDMLDKFMTQDEIIELVNDTLREATISIDV
jgi:predicted nuclease with TOPRIM domain